MLKTHRASFNHQDIRKYQYLISTYRLYRQGLKNVEEFPAVKTVRDLDQKVFAITTRHLLRRGTTRHLLRRGTTRHLLSGTVLHGISEREFDCLQIVHSSRLYHILYTCGQSFSSSPIALFSVTDLSLPPSLVSDSI